MTEHEMIAGCRRGERDAQRELYDRTGQRVYRLLFRMTRDADSALELAQDTYLKAFTAIQSFDGRASVNTWLYRIAVNEALQFFRRRTSAPLSPDLANDRPDPLNDGHRHELRMDIEAALAALEPLDRVILLLRYQEGLDYRMIAAVAQIALGTVGSRLNRARERLRVLLADYSNIGEERGPAAHRTPQGREEDAIPSPAVVRKTLW